MKPIRAFLISIVIIWFWLSIVPSGAIGSDDAESASAHDVPINATGYFVDQGACPFECCVYRTWTVLMDTVLYESEEFGTVAAVAPAGELVEGVSGAVYTKPVPVEVTHEHSPIIPGGREAVGERFYLLTYLGEGFNRVWFKGRLFDVSIAPMLTHVPHRFVSCDKPSFHCWWYIAPEHRRRQSAWHVKVRLHDGVEGWTDQADNFGNKDACG